MATIEPDGELEKLFASLDFGDLSEAEAVDYQELSERHLIEKFEEVRDALAETGQMVFPKSEHAKELSAVYHAVLLEMKRRGL